MVNYSQLKLCPKHFRDRPFQTKPIMKGVAKNTHTATVLTTIKASVKEDKIFNTPMCVENVEGHILDKYAQKNEEPNFHRAKFQLVNNSPKLPQNKLVHLINKLDNNSVVTPIKVDKFEHWLQGYNTNEKDFLIKGFKFGFSITYVGQRKVRYSKNLKSANDNPSILKEKIVKDIKAGRVAGPFDISPFPNLQISPLGLVPKKKVGEYRVIHHLSYPYHLSIHDGIPQDKCTVQYQTIDNAISLVKYDGQGSLMAKTDMENSYHLVPINERNHDLLGFTMEGKFFYDKVLPMGLSYSCNLLEKFSTAVHWVVEHKIFTYGASHWHPYQRGKYSISHYKDYIFRLRA